jgi:hypothetical protein
VAHKLVSLTCASERTKAKALAGATVEHLGTIFSRTSLVKHGEIRELEFIVGKCWQIVKLAIFQALDYSRVHFVCPRIVKGQSCVYYIYIDNCNKNNDNNDNNSNDKYYYFH